MMFPGGIGGSELQQAAADKVKNDVGTFVLFGLLVEAAPVRRDSPFEEPKPPQWRPSCVEVGWKRRLIEQGRMATGNAYQNCFIQ
ncbi:hypothetical protein ANCDUO_13393 [Ancylostoma duodenale]|uniref:Uncharacterized protein n=1 Tax=Ancylostoma duodenale TaxID=51022 RepID=A0A0C2CJ36_9BILA|nr:hypothetical protein ANCDUO_13393 [Ancylostoma duodenale]